MWNQFLGGGCHRGGHCHIRESGGTNDSPPNNTIVVVIAVLPRVVLSFSWFRNKDNDVSYKSTTASGPGWSTDT